MYERNPACAWPLVLGMLLLAGTASADHGAGIDVNVDPPINTADAQPRWRYIGERTDTSAPCPGKPSLPHWTVQPLFCNPQDPDNPDGACTTGTIPPGLRAFCSYEYSSAGHVPDGDRTFIESLEGNGLTRVDPDAMGVAGFGSGIADETWQTLEDQFEQQIGRPFVAPPVPLEANPPVRLALVDTQPTSATDPELQPHRSHHGHALVNMAKDIECNTSDLCAATVTSQLALGYKCRLNTDNNDPNCRDPVNGGWMGTISQLARAVRLQVRDWIDTGVQPHLVMNLSVAWDPRFGGLEPNLLDMPVPVRAVYAAIADAQCRGALVIAAAGNATGGQDDEPGPLLPAAWEQRHAPTQAECRSRLGTAPPAIFPPAPDTRPFVYAVAGVKGDGSQLDNARVDSEPKLVAYGDHADVEDAAGAPTATLTGSSVAALVASSTAAAAWFFADRLGPPLLKPYEVMNRVYDSGASVGRFANFCVGGTPNSPCPGVLPEVHEARICDVVDSITGSNTCPVIDPLSLSITDTDFPNVLLSSLGATETVSECGDVTVHYLTGGSKPAPPCPFAQFYNELAEPWTAPQPHESACPNCGTGGNNALAARGILQDRKLYIEIDDGTDTLPPRTWTLKGATLQCGDSDLYALPVGVLKGGSKASVTLDVAECGVGVPMLISFRDQFGESVIDPVVESVAQ